MIKTFVTGVGGGVGQGVLKSLRMIDDLDIEIVAGDMSPHAAGLYVADEAIIVPKASAPDYVDRVIEILRSREIDYYFPGTDVELLVCAENAERIREASGAEVVVSPVEAVRIADDKYKTCQFLRDHGLPHPATQLAEEADLDALDYPVVLKPRVGCRSIGVEIADSADAIRRRMQDRPRPHRARVGRDRRRRIHLHRSSDRRRDLRACRPPALAPKRRHLPGRTRAKPSHRCLRHGRG